MTFAEIVIIIWSFTKSPALGLFLSSYILYIKSSQRLVREQQRKKLDACKEELEKIKQQAEIRRKEEIKMLEGPKGFPLKIYPYKECIIEQHAGHFRIIGPDGKLLKKLFYSLESAKRDIDNYLQFIPSEPIKSVKRRRRRK